MSTDPYQPDQPTGGPGSGSPAAGRVKVPAIMLIVVACVNLLVGLAQLGRGAFVATLDPAEIRKTTLEMYEPLGADFKKQMEDQLRQTSDDQLKMQTLAGGLGCGCVSLLAAGLSLFGGIQMLKLRSYALAISGAIAVCIPCLTCSGTCCFGEVVGIWAVVVLMNEEVRRAFQ